MAVLRVPGFRFLAFGFHFVARLGFSSPSLCMLDPSILLIIPSRSFSLALCLWLLPASRYTLLSTAPTLHTLGRSLPAWRAAAFIFTWVQFLVSRLQSIPS